MIRAIVDTNILVSASFWKGNPYKIMQLAAKRKVELFTSRAILEEFVHALKRDFKTPDSEIQERLQAFLAVLNVVTPEIKVEIVTQDPTDNKVIEAALETNADYIVTGDKHLLKIKQFQHIQIVKPEQFLRKI